MDTLPPSDAQLPKGAGAGRLAPKLTVIIGCYNYGRYLPRAINSVISENVCTQIIVVDDCSTDNSADVMRAYGSQITPIFQAENQGVAAGFNAAFAQSTGDLIYFLDADDFVLPGGLKRVLSNYEPGVLIYHYRMRYADETGALAGIHPAREVALAKGDISRQLREQGRYATNVTSGLVFAREGLEKVMPISTQQYRISAEGYLVSVIPLYGPVRAYEDTLSAYRLHAAQNWKSQPDFGARARKGMQHDFHRYEAIRDHAARLGLPVARALGDADLLHLNDRLVSLAFAPDHHPVRGDSPGRIARLALRARPEGERLAGLVARSLWWTAMAFAPAGLRRQLLRWRIEPKTSPAWVRCAGRFLRKGFGVVLN